MGAIKNEASADRRWKGCRGGHISNIEITTLSLNWIIMNRSEQDILQDINDATLDQKEAKEQVAYHKKAAVDAESRLIEANISLSRLKEELRVHRITTPRYEETPRDKEIAALREKLPELLKKI